MLDDRDDPMMFRYPEELQVQASEAAGLNWSLCLSGAAAICLLVLVL